MLIFILPKWGSFGQPKHSTKISITLYVVSALIVLIC